MKNKTFKSFEEYKEYYSVKPKKPRGKSKYYLMGMELARKVFEDTKGGS